ncbi:MAG TPA: asparagine synthase (glutamine-hydrolyzing) [Ktedonobacteraceae bacterium]
MCGIAGFVDVSCSGNEADLLINAMCEVIRHRGPDDQGVWIGNGVALGMRRLAIIDLAGGRQPIFNEDESIFVVFNGEIYNYRELQKNLQERGHHFRTNSDTEVIVHAYEEHGDDCVKHLRGMFTFALWDRTRQRLLAARDRFGKKPFNYYWDGQRFIFGSEVKSILEAGIPREINPIALDEYLTYRYVPAPHTLFQGVLKLPAAHILTFENGLLDIKRYWNLPFTPTNKDNEATAIERIGVLLREAVQVRLMSEVPLGAFLSGGIDSSLVVGLMSQMMSQPVKTFSIGFEEEDYSELPYASQVARHFGTDHHEFLVRPDLISILPDLVWAYDEPFADASMLPTYYVSKLAREHVTVVLTGDGGDEIFGGYTPYRREYWINRIPPFARFILGHGSSLMPEGMRGKKRLHNLLSEPALRCVQANTLFPHDLRSPMYSDDYYSYVSDHDPLERQISEYRAASHLDIVAQMQRTDVCFYLTDDILVKVDKASMFNSLETRAPMLDQYLAEYVSSLLSTLRIHNGTLKYLLKKFAADLLPAEILARPKKGFGVPLKHWLRGDLAGYAYDWLTSSRARQRGIFDQQFIQDLLKGHISARVIEYSDAIWTLLCLEHWFRIYMDSPSPAPWRSGLAGHISNG